MSSITHHRSGPSYGPIWIAAPTVLALLSCAQEKPEARMVPAPVEMPPSAAPRVVPRDDSPIEVSEDIRTRCALPDTREGSPQFDFDSSRLRETGTSILDEVATCMLTGSLKDREVTLVGHADPRGSEMYNEELGMRRAETTRDYLISQGVPRASIAVTSRGEKDATGDDVASWQLDRRVELKSEPLAQR
jgi:outer membrane protein OmpA-like peptidoglycan-associated protein